MLKLIGKKIFATLRSKTLFNQVYDSVNEMSTESLASWNNTIEELSELVWIVLLSSFYCFWTMAPWTQVRFFQKWKIGFILLISPWKYLSCHLSLRSLFCLFLSGFYTLFSLELWSIMQSIWRPPENIQSLKIVFLFLNQNICCGSLWDSFFEHAPKTYLRLFHNQLFSI